MKVCISPRPLVSNLLFPICVARCPHCSAEFNHTHKILNTTVSCPACGGEFIYIDAFLNYFRNNFGIFIDPVHPIPVSPGYTVGGELQVFPDEIQVVTYGVIYDRAPEIFFLDRNNRPLRDLILENLYIAAVSISAQSFILLTRTFDPQRDTPERHIRWMSIGEIGKHEKPIWINILQNAVDLVLKSEEQAALVMMLVALDFFLDELLGQLNLDQYQMKDIMHEKKMSERRAKILLIEQSFRSLPKKLIKKLSDLAEQRIRIIHGRVIKSSARHFLSQDAFKVILDVITTINDLKYTYLRNKDSVNSR